MIKYSLNHLNYYSPTQNIWVFCVILSIFGVYSYLIRWWLQLRVFYVPIMIVFTWNLTHFHFQCGHFVYNLRYISRVTETTRIDWSKNVSNWMDFIKLSMFERGAVEIYISICGVFHAYSKVRFKYGATTQESNIVWWLFVHFAI